MEMCYDGTLVMPANYAVVSEDEMTYVDGGEYKTATFCYKSPTNAYNYLNDMSNAISMTAALTIVGGSIIGAAVGLVGGPVGSVIGAVVGGIAGLIGGSILWGWVAALDAAAMDCYNTSGSCKIKFEMNNLTMRFSVSSFDYSRSVYITRD